MKVALISRSTLFSVPGGDTVQIQETAAALKKIEVDVTVYLANEMIDYDQFDLLHFFNVIRPNLILAHAEKSKLPFVISTIFVDYEEVTKKLGGRVSKLLLNAFGPDGLEYIKTIARRIVNGEKFIDSKYIFRGHKKSVEVALGKAKILLPNSHNEFIRLKKRYSFTTKYKVIPNAVNSVFLEQIKSKEKEKLVVCVGRIEPIKNQLNLIRALKNSDVKLDLVGKPAPNHKKYYQQCLSEATENINFLGQIDRNGVIEKLLNAKVHVLPSWFETTGLSSLEAGALGCNVVISNKGDTKEYFESYAFYCEPGDVESIKSTINQALESEVQFELRNKIEQKYTWTRTALLTKEVYAEVLSRS